MWEVGPIEGFETIDYLEEQDIQNVLDAIDAIKGTVIEMRRKCANAERKAKAMEDKNWKDEQLQSLKRDLQETREDMFRGFPITLEQEKAVESWQKEHDTKVHDNPSQYHGVSGGGYSYVFYPTGIGTFADCICDICKRHYLKKYGESWYNACKESGGIFKFQSP